MASTFENFNEKELLNFCKKQLDSVEKVERAYSKKVYFAGPWFTKKGLMLYNTYKQIYEKCKKNSPYKVFFPKDCIFESTKETFDSDVKEVYECDIMIAIVDEKDVGTAWEIGMAHVLGKPIYFLGLDETTFLKRTNLMLAYSGKCITMPKWHKFLTIGLGHDDFVETNKCWEVIE